MLEYRLETRLSRNIGKKGDKNSNLQKLAKENDFRMGEVDWILCPFCGSKTRTKIRKDTVLIKFPLFCPKCKQESLIEAKEYQIFVIKEPDAQTQSR